ncbi:hypothetical protein N6L27_05080 [Leisingera sp. SS27]|uniref:hypothetical protein n=1 Tax=Leisingera sp. SS27 TaxID=2979462 RepID=UPI00232D5A6D|nr:hypothetical protein [Leisingera sp. SS27]MDC0657363.1 hypothetical protein [Leisingera sp. SS27]
MCEALFTDCVVRAQEAFCRNTNILSQAGWHAKSVLKNGKVHSDAAAAMVSGKKRSGVLRLSGGFVCLSAKDQGQSIILTLLRIRRKYRADAGLQPTIGKGRDGRHTGQSARRHDLTETPSARSAAAGHMVLANHAQARFSATPARQADAEPQVLPNSLLARQLASPCRFSAGLLFCPKDLLRETAEGW